MRPERNKNPNDYRLHKPDLYWLAGLLEGEGCFYLNRPDKSPSPSITLNMSDLDVVTRASRMFGGTSVRPGSRSPLSVKPTYQTVLHGRRAHAWMMTLWPLMGERRQAKISEVCRAYTAAYSCR